MEKSEANVTLDLKGLSCPMPVVKTKKALDGMQAGQILFVEATDKGSKADIPAMLKRTGNELIEIEDKGAVYAFFIKKK
ncbi:MAG: sulfurtransferase TusA family protein [Nitrospirae bacterium]|nr:sulfurtransferase TusA family protein [Nitrospirota bacterium]